MIIIIGDSWGMGEWNEHCHLNGPGFGQYLALHDEVCNLSVGGASNTLALDRLYRLLTRFRLCDSDVIYLIVTCPTRCISPNDFLQTALLQSVINDTLHQTLHRANALASANDTVIRLIGGLCDLNDVQRDLYPNLDFTVPSWCRLLDERYPVYTADCDYWDVVGERIRVMNDSDLLVEWTQIAERFTAKHRHRKAMRSSYFGTDGCHPDRRGHLVLRDWLYPDWIHKI